MRAVAERYSGRFPDPLNPGKVLPRVREFQIWNEPNLALYLSPQYERRAPFAPGRLRDMQNAAYAGIKSVQPDATVVLGGLAPYGDPGLNPQRTRPLLFLRGVLCLDNALQKSCNTPTNADVYAMHPYTRNKPSQGSFDRDDITVPDLARLQAAMAAARSAGTVGPKLPPLWVTEIHWESAPADPKGTPLPTRARYISEAMWRLWRAGVPVAYWYLMQDEEPDTSSTIKYQSGIYTRAGRRKSDSRAFRFPLLVTSRRGSTMNVWFRTPTAGTTTVQVRRGGVWVTVLKKRKLPKDGVASVKVPRASVSGVRAFAGKAKSYVWDVD
jgi:hypothetical protein